MKNNKNSLSNIVTLCPFPFGYFLFCLLPFVVTSFPYNIFSWNFLFGIFIRLRHAWQIKEINGLNLTEKGLLKKLP